jgi:endonuclease III
MATASRLKLAAGVLDALRRKDGVRRVPANGGMTEVLLSVIIARGSSVTAARRALDSIKEGIVNWNELRVTQPADVAVMLSGIRDADGKAEAIHDVLTNIFEGTHDLNLSFLEGASAEEARDFLAGLGSLTDDMVNEVILAGRGHFTMAADADTVRIAQRLGLVGKTTSPAKAQSDLEEVLGSERSYQLMYLIKNLAQAACSVRNPRCGECALAVTCPTGRKGRVKAR